MTDYAAERLWRIEAPHFVAGLLVRNGRIAEAAPILRWGVGKEWAAVKSYMRRKGWHGAAVSAP